MPDCNYNKPIASLLTLNAFIFTYMFSSFYIRTYLKNNKASSYKKTDTTEIDENKNSTSGSYVNGVASANGLKPKTN